MMVAKSLVLRLSSGIYCWSNWLVKGWYTEFTEFMVDYHTVSQIKLGCPFVSFV